MTTDDLIPQAQLGWGTKLFLLFLGVSLFALAIFLIFPAENAAVPDWVSALQSQLWYVVAFLAPYGLVALLGGIIGVAELASTFPTYPREALQTRWAWILIAVNMLAAILALMIVQATMPDTNRVLQIIGVGVGFQALIRTRFVLAKPIGGADTIGQEASINLGWLYDQFQHLCRTQIDLELMNNRRTAVTRLIKYYPTLAQLYHVAWYTVIARVTLTPEEEKSRLESLEKLIDPQAPENFAKASIALMILESGGQAYVELLLNQAMAETAPEAAVAAQQTVGQLVRRLVNNYNLSQLVELCQQLTSNPAVLNWVQQAAQPEAGTSEANQKAAIAHFIIQEIGLEKVQQFVQQSTPLAGEGLGSI